jgi:hypothetical protein
MNIDQYSRLGNFPLNTKCKLTKNKTQKGGRPKIDVYSQCLKPHIIQKNVMVYLIQN